MKKTKNKPLITILLLLATVVVGCQENNSISAGASTLQDNDIRVMSDTFSVASQLDSCVASSENFYFPFALLSGRKTGLYYCAPSGARF